MEYLRNAFPLRATVRWRRRCQDALLSPRGLFLLYEPLFRLSGLRRTQGLAPRAGQSRTILVVRVDEIGDVILTTPFLRELRRNYPAAWVTLVVKPQVHDLVVLCPYVNEVLTYEWDAAGVRRRHLRALSLAATRLWRRRFDVAIVPRWDVDPYHATFVAYMSGARARVGYSETVNARKAAQNAGYDRLLTDAVRPQTAEIKHEVERNLDLIRHLGGAVRDESLELWTDRGDESFADAVIASQRIAADAPLIAFGVGKRDERRRWPAERFVELAKRLISRCNARIVLVGEPAEEALGTHVAGAVGDAIVNKIGQTTLRQCVALMRRCRLYVGNDYGPKHIAAAVGVPVVEINGHPAIGDRAYPDSPQRFGPWNGRQIVLQPAVAVAPCRYRCEAQRPHCILAVSVDAVEQAAGSLLSALAAPLITSSCAPSR